MKNANDSVKLIENYTKNCGQVSFYIETTF